MYYLVHSRLGRGFCQGRGSSVGARHPATTVNAPLRVFSLALRFSLTELAGAARGSAEQREHFPGQLFAAVLLKEV